MTRPELTKIIAARIRRLRDERGWSARRLAEQCEELGMPSLSRSTIAKIEAGLRGIDVEELHLLAMALGVTFDQLTADTSITVLHLSNLRFAPGQAFGSPVPAGTHEQVLQALCTDLDLLSRSLAGARPDLVVVSGDLAVTGRPREFDLVKAFLEGLAEHLGVGFGRIAIVPGERDVNEAAARAYLAQCEADDVAPVKPYWHNWRHFATLFDAWPEDRQQARMQREHPWSLFELPDLRVVVAGLNSTIDAEPAAPGSGPRPGRIGAEQARHLAESLATYEERGWLRIGVVHHDPHGGTGPEQERLADADLFDGPLGHRLNLLLHGNGDEKSPAGSRLAGGLPAFGLGPTPGPDAASRYQLLRLTEDGLVRLSRRFDREQARWVGEAGDMVDPPRWSSPVTLTWRGADNTFPVSSAHRVVARSGDGWRPAGSDWEQLDSRRLLLDQIADVCLARHPGAVVHRIKGAVPYLRVTYADGGRARQLRVGACVRTVGEHDVDAFLEQVHGADPDVESELVYQGDEPARALRDYARRRKVRLRSFLQFQGLLDLTGYLRAQSEALLADPRYPAQGYVPQRFVDKTHAAARPHADGEETRDDLVAELLELVDGDEGRFVLLLGDFGRGKTFALRELTRRITAELPHVLPILIDLRASDKANTLEGHVAAHLANHGHDKIDLPAFRYMLDHGRIVLIFDGFDELVARATYARAADHLGTLLAAARGHAKIIVASRTQHFAAHSQVATAMEAQLGSLPQRRVLSLSHLSAEQIRALLIQRFGGQVEEVDRRLELLASIPGLMPLATNPRMLSFIADLPTDRLRAVSAASCTISPARLYAEIIDAWLGYEGDRTQDIRGVPVGLAAGDLFAAVTALALRLWERGEALMRVEEIEDLAGTLTDLAGRHLSAEQITHAIGAGSLLIRTDDGVFSFIHESVTEWLVARHLADDLAATDREHTGRLHAHPLSQLTIDFLCDLAEPSVCRRWADRVLNDPDATPAARMNAGRIIARFSTSPGLNLRSALLSGLHLTARSWPAADLTDADLTGARLADMALAGATLRGARLAGVAIEDSDLSGADLREANLTGARIVGSDLSGADLTGADLTDARILTTNLTDAVLTDVRWRRAAVVSATAEPAALDGLRRCGAVVLPGSPLTTAVRPVALGVLFGFEEGRLPRPVGYDAEGALLAIGCEDGSVLICDARDNRPLRTLTGHEWRTYSVNFSPTEPLLATGAQDGLVRLWDATTGECRHVLSRHREWVWPLLFDSSGTLLATGDKDGVVRVWEVGTGQLRWELPGHRAPVWTATFNPDGSTLATGDDGGVVRLWDLRTGRLRQRAEAEDKLTYWLRHDPTGTYLAGGAEDGALRLWDPRTGRLLHRLTGHAGPIYTFDFHPSGRHIVSADVTGSVRRWDLPEGGGPPVGRELGRHSGAVYRVAFSPRGTMFATGDSDGWVRIWDDATCEVRHELDRHYASVWPITFRPDGDRLVSSSNDFTTKVWSTRSGESAAVLRGHGRQMRAVAFNRDGSMLATSSNDGLVRLWDPIAGECRQVLESNRMDRLVSVAFGAEPHLLATASNDGRVYLWDAAAGVEGRQLEVSSDAVWAMVFDPAGDRIAVANDDHTVQLLIRTTGRTVGWLRGFRGRVRALAYSPDGATLATGSDDELVRLHDLAADEVRVLPKAHSGRILCLAYRPDGRLLASASVDGTAVLWDPQEQAVLRVLRPERRKLWTVAFHPGGRFLATAGDEEVIDIWDAQTGQRVQELTGHTRRIWSVAFSPGGDLLASGSTDGTVRLWQLAPDGTATHRCTLLGLSERSWAAFTPNGRHKSAGEVAADFWHVAGMCRFDIGELDPYLDDVGRVPAGAPLRD
ncbi:pentapeptide repeat-containing protein [Micromonospora sp. ATCC 39149]|uniref:Pentapeptide repeat-containing protein n=1 Tax=Micromonospora carbonacea TaxID=47853 RepID=A0A7D6CGK5_9ACTN|nr:pentapeptide repeat-containing protein [Micromonospora sp. ATCC 39149]QLK00938.1 pentapeptide repeat-containing protein [Micromonospora carbonacea]